MPKAFEPFLKGMKEQSDATTQAASREGSIQEHMSAASAIVASLVQSQPAALTRLQQDTQLSFREFSDAVNSLLDSGLIELTGPKGEEVAQLSPAGSAFAARAS
jgi:hypothetical protein